MVTVSKDTILNKEIIEGAIEENEKQRNRFNILEDYYLGNHAILSREEALGSTNEKVVVNHAKYITDINTGYLLGTPVIYKTLEEGVEIGEIIDEYDKQNISGLDVELVKDISIFGKQYELQYTDGNEVRSKDIDVRNAVCIYDDTVQHKKLFGIVYQIKADKKGFDKVTVYSEKYKYEDCTNLKGEIIIPKGEVHSFGKVPLIEYRNNSEELGDFETVIPLIDAYNTLQSDRINDYEQTVRSILLGYGTKLTPTQRKNLESFRMLFDLPIKGEAHIEFLNKELNEQQVEVLRKSIENDIHKISMTPNMTDENFLGNSSGVALAYKLLPFDQNIKNKERFFETGLMERLEIYNNYLVSISKGAKVDTYKVDAVFNRALPQNLLELSQIVNNLRGVVDDETLVGLLPFVQDPEQSIKKAQEEQLSRYMGEVGEFGTLNETTSRVENRINEEVG